MESDYTILKILQDLGNLHFDAFIQQLGLALGISLWIVGSLNDLESFSHFQGGRNPHFPRYFSDYLLCHLRVEANNFSLLTHQTCKVVRGLLVQFSILNFRQVYSWGDNDHGQQGNGGTMVNQKPTPVDDFGNVKVNRVACGSSHSVAWQAYEPPVCTSVEPVTLNAINDPLGANLLGT